MSQIKVQSQRHSRSRHTIAQALVVLSVVTSLCRAVDVLPPELRNAPDAQKRAYVESIAKDSLALQREMGKQRLDARIEMKHSIMHFADAMANEVRAQALGQEGPAETKSNAEETGASLAGAGRWCAGILLLGIAIGVFFKLAKPSESTSR